MFTEMQMMAEGENPTEETCHIVRTVPGSGNEWKQQRDFLCYANGSAPGHEGVIPVRGPTNNQVVAGQCLIWCGPLNRDGYPKGERNLRDVFRKSRGRRPTRSVLHLCHRRSCVQPSHLYEGSPRDNAEDRRHRFGGLRAQKWELPQDNRPLLDRLYASKPSTDWGRVHRERDRANEAADYYRPPPDGYQMAFDGNQPRFLEHECVPGVPAGDAYLCRICEMTSAQRAGVPTMENILRWEPYWPQWYGWPLHNGPSPFWIPQTQN